MAIHVLKGSTKEIHLIYPNFYCSLQNKSRATTLPSDERKSYKYLPPKIDDEHKSIKSSSIDITTLVKSSRCDEKTELEVLKNYFESMSYSEICNDDDFKTYLKKKNYQDAIDYIYSGHSLLGSSLREESVYGSVTDVLKRYYDLDLDIVKQPNQNDCDSVKNARSQSVDRRKYYNKENSEFFCKSNKEFDDYYKRNIAIFYEATKTIDDDFLCDNGEDEEEKEVEEESLYDTFEDSFYHRMPSPNDEEVLIDELYGRKNSDFSYNTMPERSLKNKIGSSFDIDEGLKGDDDEAEFTAKYQTYPLKRKSRARNYKQLLKYCEKSLANYSTVDMRFERWCLAGSTGSSIISNHGWMFSEKAYQKIIKAFVRLRGFESVEAYVQYHYGRILDKSFDSNLKIKLREALSRRDEQLVISRPILKTTTQSSVIANNRLDSLPPPYTSIDNDNNYFYKKHQSSNDTKTKAKNPSMLENDCFKHYDYIDVNYKQTTSRSSTDDNELDKNNFLFKFVEDMHDSGISFCEIILGQHERGVRNRYETNKESENQHDVRNQKSCNEKQQHNKINHASSSEIRQNQNNSIDNIYESIEIKPIRSVASSNIKNAHGHHHHHNNQQQKQNHQCCNKERRRRAAQMTHEKA